MKPKDKCQLLKINADEDPKYKEHDLYGTVVSVLENPESRA